MKFSTAAFGTIAAAVVAGDYKAYDIPTGKALLSSTESLMEVILHAAKDVAGKPGETLSLRTAYLCPMASELRDTIDSTKDMVENGLNHGDKLDSGLKQGIDKVCQQVDKLVAQLQQNNIQCERVDQLSEKNQHLRALMDDDFRKKTQEVQQKKNKAKNKRDGGVVGAVIVKRDKYPADFPTFEESVSAANFDDEHDSGNEGKNKRDDRDDETKDNVDLLASAIADSLKTVKESCNDHYNDKHLSQDKFDDKFLCEYTDKLRSATKKLYKQQRKGKKAGNAGAVKRAADDWATTAKDRHVRCNKVQKLVQVAKLL